MSNFTPEDLEKLVNEEFTDMPDSDVEDFDFPNESDEDVKVEEVSDEEADKFTASDADYGSSELSLKTDN